MFRKVAKNPKKEQKRQIKREETLARLRKAWETKILPNFDQL